MKKITLLIVALLAFNFGNSQTNIFFDDFESYTDFIITGIGDWDVLDLDGLGTYSGGGGTFDNQNAAMAFMIFNPTAAAVTNDLTGASGETRDFDPYSGVKYAAAWAAVPGANPANDDWLISPVVTLAESGNTVSFQVKAMSNTYGDESYEVGVYVGTGDPTGSGDFTVLGGTRTATFPDWELINVDLSAYNEMDIRIGIHYTSSDVYMLMVDDFSVDTTLGLDEFATNTFNHSYNKDTKQLKLESSNLPFDSIEVFNILGQNVISKSLSQLNEVIDLANLKDGVYLAKVTIQGQTQTIKLLKQ